MNEILIHVSDTSQEFRSGLERLQKLFSIPAKPNDHTSVLQALSKLIVDKLNTTSMQDALTNNSQVTATKNVNKHLMNRFKSADRRFLKSFLSCLNKRLLLKRLDPWTLWNWASTLMV